MKVSQVIALAGTVTGRTINTIDLGIQIIENVVKVGHAMSEDFLEDQQFEREMKLAQRRIERAKLAVPIAITE